MIILQRSAAHWNSTINKKKQLPFAINKMRAKIQREISSLEECNRHLATDVKKYEDVEQLELKLVDAENSKKNAQTYLDSVINSVIEILQNNNFIIKIDAKWEVTTNGIIAANIQEAHPLALSDIYNITNGFNSWKPSEIAALFSCFTNIRVLEDFKDNVPKSADKMVNDKVKEVLELYEDYQKKELERNINTGFDYDIHYDLLNYVEEWCDCENVEDCKQILQKMAGEKEIFLGEFVKALL